MSSELAISVSDVSKKYQVYSKPIHRLKQFLVGSGRPLYKEFVALNNINMQINRGSTVGIVGRNGSGKSTLLQIIAGTLTPTTGNVIVAGRVAALLELGAGFNPDFTGRENVFMNATILGIETNEVKERFQQIADFADIGDFIDQPVKTYSSGMFVRLAFAVATLTSPDVIIIDEALSVGDEKFQRKCYNHLESMKEKGCTILFVSHSMRTVEQICDYAYLLDCGQLIAEGQPKSVIDQYHLLLYSHENDHMKFLNNSTIQEIEAEKVESVLDEAETQTNDELAKIVGIKLFDQMLNESYVFKPGQKSIIRMTVFSKVQHDDIMIGLRIKTTHGIEVYGTSTAYNNYEIISLKANKYVTIDFIQDLQLVAGTYHISVAVAKKVGKNDMMYLDKLSDHLLFKVEEIPITGTGIAHLNTIITITED